MKIDKHDYKAYIYRIEDLLEEETFSNHKKILDLINESYELFSDNMFFHSDLADELQMYDEWRIWEVTSRHWAWVLYKKEIENQKVSLDAESLNYFYYWINSWIEVYIDNHFATTRADLSNNLFSYYKYYPKRRNENKDFFDSLNLFLKEFKHIIKFYTREDYNIEFVETWDGEKIIKEEKPSRKFYMAGYYKDMLDSLGDCNVKASFMEKLYQEAVSIFPHHEDLIFWRAYDIDNNKEKIHLYENWLKIYKSKTPNQFHSAISIEVVYNNLGLAIIEVRAKEKYTYAEKILLQAISICQGEYYKAVANLAKLYLIQDKEDKTYNFIKPYFIDFFQKIQEESTDFEDEDCILFLYYLSEISYKMEDFKTARYFIEKEIELSEEKDPDSIYLLRKIKIKEKKLFRLFEKKEKPTYNFWLLKEKSENIIEEDKNQSFTKLLKTLLSSEEYQIYKNLDKKIFWEDTKDYADIEKSELEARIIHDFLHEKMQVLEYIDWSGEDEEGILKNFVDRRLKFYGFLNFSWDFYTKFKEKYNFEKAERGDYIYDLLIIVGRNLAKEGFVLGDLNTPGDNYYPFVLPKEDFKKIQNLKDPQSDSQWSIRNLEFMY